MNERMEMVGKWVEEWMNSWIIGCIDGWMVEWMHACIKGQMDGSSFLEFLP